MMLNRNSPRAACTLEQWHEPEGNLGGDFVLFHRDGDVLRLVVGDATGHGDDAADFAASARRILAADLAGPITLQTLVRWSAGISALGEERFVTCTAVEVDVANGRARVTNAGNPPALILRGSPQRVDELRSTGMPLGLVEPSAWRAPVMVEFPISSQDVLVCFTDGLIDRTGQSREQFGIDRVRRSVSNSGADSPLDALGRCVVDFTDYLVEQDDLTVVAVRMR